MDPHVAPLEHHGPIRSNPECQPANLHNADVDDPDPARLRRFDASGPDNGTKQDMNLNSETRNTLN